MSNLDPQTSAPEPTVELPAADVARKFPLPQRAWRRFVARTFAVLGTVFLMLSLTAGWVHNTVMNTDDYIAAVGELPSQPGVAHLIATNVTTALIDQGVPALQQQIKDPTTKSLVPLAAQALQPQIEKAVETGVRSSQFKRLWVMANRETHALLLKVLEGGTIAGVQTGGTEIVVNVGNIADSMLPSLANSSLGKTIIKIAKNGEIKIPIPDALVQARAQIRMANQFYALLVLLTVLFLLGAVALHDRPRRMAERMGWSIAGTALGFIVIVRIAIFTSAGSILDSDVAAAAKEVASAVSDSLIHASITTMLLAALVAAAARFLGRAYPRIP